MSWHGRAGVCTHCALYEYESEQSVRILQPYRLSFLVGGLFAEECRVVARFRVCCVGIREISHEGLVDVLNRVPSAERARGGAVSSGEIILHQMGR